MIYLKQLYQNHTPSKQHQHRTIRLYLQSPPICRYCHNPGPNRSRTRGFGSTNLRTMQLIPPLQQQDLHGSFRSPSPPRHVPTLSSITEATPTENTNSDLTTETTYVTDYDLIATTTTLTCLHYMPATSTVTQTQMTTMTMKTFPTLPQTTS